MCSVCEMYVKVGLRTTWFGTVVFVRAVATVPVTVAATQSVDAGAVIFTLKLVGPTHCWTQYQG